MLEVISMGVACASKLGYYEKVDKWMEIADQAHDIMHKLGGAGGISTADYFIALGWKFRLTAGDIADKESVVLGRDGFYRGGRLLCFSGRRREALSIFTEATALDE